MADPLFPLEPESRESLHPQCPFCRGTETERLSDFGGQLSVAQCWCRSCRTGFEYLKWGADPKEGRPGTAER